MLEEVKDAIDVSDTKVVPLKTTFSSGEKAPGDLYDEKLKEIAGLDSNTNTKITSLVGITADVGLSGALLSDRQHHFYGSKGSVPEAFYTGISTVLSVSPVLCNYRALYIQVLL